MGMAESRMTVAFPAPYGTVFDAFARSADSLKGCRLSKADPATGTLDLSVGVSMLSWGESVRVAVYVPQGQQWTYADLSSQSSFALVDWGKNKGNLDKLLAAVAAVAGQYQVVRQA